MKKLIFLITALSMLAGCRKDDAAYDGISIEELYSDFLLLQPLAVNSDSIDFVNGEAGVFTARFNKPVNWTLEIHGQNSGAKKIIEGVSKSLDASNATWDGSTTVFPMFKAEPCSVRLFIEGVSDTFEVQTAIKSIKVNDGLVIADFENGFNPAWTRFVQSGANMDFNVKTDTLSPQGAKYLKMAGTVAWDWLIGLVDFPATAYGGGNTLPLATNPDNVYFNCLIYGVPNTNESLVLFQFKEDENGDGIYNANTDDQYDLQVTVNWEGWKLVSVRYRDLPSLSNGQPTTPKGNGLHNPDKIAKISLLDLANPANGYAHCKIDYLIFTPTPLAP
ncbi:MAG: membrane lipoprotein lipid attachment site-containing protein [Bacteroidota bacterium]